MPLAGRPAEIFALDDVREVARALAHECAAVARAEGVELSERDADDVIAWLEALPTDAGSSILADRLAGRALEWEARNGVIGRLGRRHGVATPVADTVSALLHAASDGRRRPVRPPMCEHTFVRWDNLTIEAQEGTALPGYREPAVVRHFDAPEALDTRFYEVRAKSALNRVPERSRMPFRWTINPYRGCSHACVYCLGAIRRSSWPMGGRRPLAQLSVGDASRHRARGHYRRYVDNARCSRTGRRSSPRTA